MGNLCSNKTQTNIDTFNKLGKYQKGEILNDLKKGPPNKEAPANENKPKFFTDLENSRDRSATTISSSKSGPKGSPIHK